MKTVKLDLHGFTDALDRLPAEQNKRVFGHFVNDDPTKAITRVMGTKDPAGAMDELIVAARKDKTGQAYLGLKKAVADWLDSKLTANKAIGDDATDYIIMANQVERLPRK